MSHVFVDTGAFFAALDAHDVRHTEAVTLLTSLRVRHLRLITTHDVVSETVTLLRARLTDGVKVALAFLDARDAGEFDVVYPDEIDRDRAEAILRAHRDKTYSYCDATSFAVMERFRIREALTFDKHFAQFGVITVAL